MPNTINEDVLNVLTTTVNGLPYGTGVAAKETTLATNIANGLDASDDELKEVPSRIRMFVKQTVRTAQRTASDINKFSDVDAKVQEEVDAALDNYAALRGIDRADFTFHRAGAGTAPA